MHAERVYSESLARSMPFISALSHRRKTPNAASSESTGHGSDRILYNFQRKISFDKKLIKAHPIINIKTKMKQLNRESLYNLYFIEIRK